MRAILLFLSSALLCGGQFVINPYAFSGGGGGGGTVSRVTGTDTLASDSATPTHTITVPATAELMIWVVGGYDNGVTDKASAGTFTLDPGGDDVDLTPITSSTGTNHQGSLFLVDVRDYAGGDVDIDASYGSGTWLGGAWHAASFYTGCDMSSLPGSAYDAADTDELDNSTTDLSVGPLATTNNGMAVAAYTYFDSDVEVGRFVSGATAYLSTGNTGTGQEIIIGEVATTGSDVTVVADATGGTAYNCLHVITLTP